MTDDLDLTRRLAHLMGWEETKRMGEITTTDEPRIYLHPRDGVLIGVAFLISADDDPERRYDRSFRSWRPLDAIGDAKQIIDRLGALGWEYMLGSCADGHYAQFSNYERRPGRPWPEWYSEVAPTLERAICLAALQVSASLHALAGEGEG